MTARWAFLDDHLDRLFEAAKAIDLDIGLDRGRRAPGRSLDTQAANGMQTDAHARLMVTRGVKTAAVPASDAVAAAGRPS